MFWSPSHLGINLRPARGAGQTRKVALSVGAWRENLLRSGVENRFVLPGTEIVGLTFICGLEVGRAIDSHSANGAKSVIMGIHEVRMGIHPAAALIFHVVRGLFGDFSAKIALDHAEREINAGGNAARRGELAVFDKTHTALDVDIWKYQGEVNVGVVMRGRGLGPRAGLFLPG